MHNRFNIPTPILWIVLIICIVPSIFVFPYLSDTASTVPSTISYRGFIFFNIWLIAGIAVALITGVLSFVDYQVKKDLATPVIGTALITVALFQAIVLLLNADSSTHLLSHKQNYQNWFTTRALYLTLLILSSAYLIGKSRARTKKPANKKLILALVPILSAVCLGVAMFVNSQDGNLFPKYEANTFITHPYEAITLVAYILTGFLLLPPFQRHFPSLFSRLLILTIIPGAFAGLFMSVHRSPFDIFFNTAYFLNFIHYTIPLLGIALNYIETTKKERRVISQLHQEIRDRIATQQKLKKREALLAKAEKIAHLGSWEYDIDTKAVEWSDEMYNIFGVSSDYIPSTYIHDEAIVEAYRERVKREIGSAVRNKSTYHLEFQIKRPDGTIRHLLSQGEYAASDNKLVNILLDITELKEATQKLSQSESLLREAEAISHNGSWEWSTEKNSFFWSDELYRIHGLLPNDSFIDLRHYLSFIHPEDVQRFVSSLAETQKGLKPFSLEYRIIRPNGDIRHLLLSGKFKTDFSGNVERILGNTQDITELKKTTLLLDRSESLYRTIAKNAPDSAVFVFDTTKELLLKEGPAIEKIDPEGLFATGATFELVVFNQDFQTHRELLEQALAGNAGLIEHKISGKTFKTFYTPAFSSDGEIFGVITLMHDVTDLKKAQQELEQKISELKRSNQDLEQFAYVASHDLQEPLRKIKSFGDRLKRNYAATLPDEAQDFINRMSNASDRMQTLIDDLLTLSRVRKTEDLAPTNLAETIKEVLYDLEHLIEQKRARIEVQANVTIPAIPSQIRQLFQNLLTNSLKFSKEGQPVQIKISSKLISGNSVSNSSQCLNKEWTYVQVELRDNGIGFDQQYSSAIFSLFHRLHSRSEFAGTGIGLAVCKKIVENHDGFIEAEGEQNEGALFRIFVPANRES
ncbi:PAS domain-containing protein [Pedobacter sp. SYSU D00535]|uniref:PAS domain-containing protein n=1 Tax=Pedobacter sp. SYSU D00535 TaxID=2810308 RepID=UPI001A965161|nr:PAS domain-containing protein [Pedobacter sp. SYSU D00535]